MPHSCNPTAHIPECDGPATGPFYGKCNVPDVRFIAGPTEDDPLTVGLIGAARGFCSRVEFVRDRGTPEVVGFGCR